MLGDHPRLHQSYDHCLELTSILATYMGHPEILAAQLICGRMEHRSFTGSPPPNVPTANSDTIHLLCQPMSKHDDSLTNTFPPFHSLANALPTGAQVLTTSVCFHHYSTPPPSPSTLGRVDLEDCLCLHCIGVLPTRHLALSFALLARSNNLRGLPTTIRPLLFFVYELYVYRHQC